MDDAAREAVSDVTPPRLRDRIEDRVAETTATPGVLTRASARAAGQPPDDELDRRAAGVQLIYDGLSITRSLARSPPWEERSTVAADMSVLVADALVARGFYLLARTGAAGKAVGTVRAFGHDETAAETVPDAAAGALETDVFELAVVAGVSAAGAEPPEGTRGFAADLAAATETNGTKPSGALSESTIDALDDLLAGAPEAPSDPARAPSGTTDT
jgi:hypothetical protein